MTSTATDPRRLPAAVLAIATALFLALSMVVATPAFADYSEDERFVLLDRGADERVAYVHDDHWHGSLPPVPLDDNISLGAQITGDDGEELSLDGSPYSLGVALDGDEGVVELDEHGDHVHIIGVSEGETRVVFRLLNDGEVEYETPSIAVVVSADPDAVADDDDHGHSHDDDDHSHDDDHDHDDAPEGGVDAGFGGAATGGSTTTTTLLLTGMVLFALLAVALVARPTRAAARR
jgi:hypothetical protein